MWALFTFIDPLLPPPSLSVTFAEPPHPKKEDVIYKWPLKQNVTRPEQNINFARNKVLYFNGLKTPRRNAGEKYHYLEK